MSLKIEGFWVVHAVSRAALETGFTASNAHVRHVALATAPSPLTALELSWARTAWAYFPAHCDKRTGLCPTNAIGTSTTPASIGSQILAILCAWRLSILSNIDASAALNQIFDTVIELPLFAEKLPSHAYDVESLRTVDHRGQTCAAGSGWSALDIMRLCAAFIATAAHMPDVAPVLALILHRWQMDEMVSHGRFTGLRQTFDATAYRFQDGRLGGEQYAARAGAILGLPIEAALDAQQNFKIVTRHKHPTPADRRPMIGTTMPAILPSDPFYTEAFEFGWRSEMLDIAIDHLNAQKARFEATGHLTALGHVQLDQHPWSAIQGVSQSPDAAGTVSPERSAVAPLCLSTACCFGWWASLRSAYAQKLVDAVIDLQGAKGWYAGVYEESGSINTALSLDTNAIVLEALHYKACGPLYPQ